MKIENVNGFSKLEGQFLFSVSPEDITWRMRDNWLDSIAAGHTVMLDTVIPYLEREAVSRFENEWTVKGLIPDIGKGYEDWRLWWLNEASNNCDTHDPIGRAGDHLTVVGRSAVNILMTASALRDSIDASRAEESAALGMMLICEALSGGYGLERDATKDAHESLLARQQETYKKSIGVESEDQARARQACIGAAAKIWAADPNRRIGEVSKELNTRLLNNLDKLPTLDMTPAPETIKGWLQAAAKEGKLVIPEAAQKGGRPPKK